MRKNIFAIVAVIVLGLVGILVYSGRTRTSESGTSSTVKQDDSQPKETPVKVINQEAKITLSAFPEGFPTEKDALRGDSFKYIPANSQEQQSSLVYQSQKTLAANEKIFKEFFAKAGFKIVNQQETKTEAFYYTTLDNNDLSVQIKDQQNVVTVTASYLKRPQ